MCHQTIANGQQGVVLRRIRGTQVVLQHANGDTAEHVDKQNENAGYGVAAHELAGTVHGPVEIGLLRHFLATAQGVVLTDQAGIQVGINRHLLAGHGVQGKARGDF